MRLLLFTASLIIGFSSSQSHAKDESKVSHRVTPTTRTQELPTSEEYSRDTVFTPSEFAPATELQMTSYIFDTLDNDLVGQLDKSTSIMVIVESKSEGNRLIKNFKQLGGDPNQVHPLVTSYDSNWYQDYGPIYSVNSNHEVVANDFIYNRYGRVRDDAVPAAVAAAENNPHHKVTMNYEGGNFISDGKGTCFASTRIFEQNPQLTQSQVAELMKANLGCNQFVTLKPLLNDITYHIDLFAKMVDDHTFFVGDFIDQKENRKIMDENAKILESLGYTVYRLPVRSTSEANHRTHINTFLINGLALMPTYGIPEDDISAKMYEKVGFKVIRIKANWFENQGGAIHCVLRSKPLI